MKPSKQTIRRRLKELRDLIDNSPDLCEQRIAYAMETAITWATSDTSWPRPVEEAKLLARLLRGELKLGERHDRRP